MAVYTSIAIDNIIGGTSVTAVGTLNLNQFTQQCATEKLTIDSFALQASSYNQLGQPFGLVTRTMAGQVLVDNVTPIPDLNQFAIVLPRIDTKGFVLDGLSSIQYNILPGEFIHLVVKVLDQGFQNWQTVSGGKSTFQTVTDMPVPPQFTEFDKSTWGDTTPIDQKQTMVSADKVATSPISPPDQTVQNNMPKGLILGSFLVIFAIVGYMFTPE